MFHSANFKLTNTEMKDHIKAMKTLLGDPTQLKNDANAVQAVRRLQQVTLIDIYVNDILQIVKVKCTAHSKNTMSCNRNESTMSIYSFLSFIYCVMEKYSHICVSC